MHNPKAGAASRTTESDCPSYEESMRTSHNRLSQASPSTPWTATELSTQLSIVRGQRIRSLLDTYIQPLLAEQSLLGIHKCIFILIPSDVTALHGASSDSGSKSSAFGGSESHAVNAADKITGVPTDGSKRLVQLTGEENQIDFWRQAIVIDELRSELRARLLVEGAERAAQIESSSSVAAPHVEAEPSRKRPFSRFRSGRSGKSTHDPDTWQPMRLGGWGSQCGNGTKAPQQSQVRVDVSMNEVGVRGTTDFGLLETRTGNAIIITVEVGGFGPD